MRPAVQTKAQRFHDTIGSHPPNACPKSLKARDTYRKTAAPNIGNVKIKKIRISFEPKDQFTSSFDSPGTPQHRCLMSYEINAAKIATCPKTAAMITGRV